VSAYARAVLAGKIIAGQQVKDACQRHLNDLTQAPKRGFFFDHEKAARAIGFFKDVLLLNGGEYEGAPFVLDQWQTFIVGSLFGWVDADGLRRFRICYIETAKGSGKSPLAAGIGLYGLVADNEPRAEVYAAATKKDQAMVLFRDAVAMVDQSPILRQAIGKSGVGERVYNLAYLKAGSFFRPISADDGQSGPRPHIALLDEIHEHRDNRVVEMLRAGTKSRRQALIVMITNSGSDKNSVCWGYHDYTNKINNGTLQDDSHFGFITGLDENDDPLRDETCWAKANPSLQFSNLPGKKYLREQVTQARGMPSKESLVRRLNFCQWTDAENPWLSGQLWHSNQDNFTPESLVGRRCFAGLDLSATQDLTALALVFPPEGSDPHWRLLSYFWLPGDTLLEKEDKDRVPYTVWRTAGYLETFPGRAINKLAIVKRFMQIADLYDLQGVAYDLWHIEEFKARLDEEGVTLPLQGFGQGYKSMSPAVNRFETLLLEGQLKHNGNPIMTWCAANAVTDTDPAGNRKVTKEKATGRVDGIVAALMALGLAGNFEATVKTIKQGFVSL
jgi:phage terminase large subunit-like protein